MKHLIKFNNVNPEIEILFYENKIYQIMKQLTEKKMAKLWTFQKKILCA